MTKTKSKIIGPHEEFWMWVFEHKKFVYFLLGLLVIALYAGAILVGLKLDANR